MLSQGLRVWVNSPALKKQGGESKRQGWDMHASMFFQQSPSQNIMMNASDFAEFVKMREHAKRGACKPFPLGACNP